MAQNELKLILADNGCLYERNIPDHGLILDATSTLVLRGILDDGACERLAGETDMIRQSLATLESHVTGEDRRLIMDAIRRLAVISDTLLTIGVGFEKHA